MKATILLKDETYKQLWLTFVKKTQGYRVVIGIMTILIIIVSITIVINVPSWPTWTGLAQKTAWDLLDLAIIPISVAIIVYLLNKRQRENELEIAEKQREQELKIAKKQRKKDREIAQDRIEEIAVQNYINSMTALILEKNLHQSAEGDQVRNIARVRTLTVLRGLNHFRKRTVLYFLYESELIQAQDRIVDLTGAELRGLDLADAFLPCIHLGAVDLGETDLSRADLSGANLEGANLEEVYFFQANLENANLAGANLENADLSAADLTRANLKEAMLMEAKLVVEPTPGYVLNAILEEANLEGVYLPINLKRINFKGANLTEAILVGADLTDANLTEAKLVVAELTGANLTGATLTNVRLTGASYNDNTEWPDGFDPEKADAILVE